MALTPGTRLGPYEVTAQIGVGGMGQVYRARDSKLQRDVALKVVPDAFAQDGERLARFEREARTLAALNHPNIAAVYGLEASGGITALVMELVEGEDLSQRIARGAIPLDEVSPIANQIAEALEAAHELTIVHRDLKPANIKVRPDGVVKVLDFGLAKALGPAVKPDFSQAPTITSPGLMTSAGMILGTAAYMSPEQARGRTVDKRTDIWAFGCVLYEMLTGARAFPGEDLTETLARVVEREPDFDALPESVPSRVSQALRVCLRKDSRQRAGDIRDVRLALEGAFETAPAQRVATTAKGLHRVATLAAGALVVAAAAGAAVWVATRPAPPVPARIWRVTISPRSPAEALTVNGSDRDLAMTPDGAHVIYVGNRGTQLFVRALDALEPVAVFTGLPRAPFVSPDGQWIGFIDGGATFKRVALTGGPAIEITRLTNIGPRGATWAPDDTIVFASDDPTTGLQRAAVAGGPTIVLTRPDRAKGEADHFWPEMLPGGRALLFTVLASNTAGNPEAAQIALLDLRTGAHKILLNGGSHAHYLSSGHLIYAAAGTLRAVPFDLASLETRGTPVPVVPAVVTQPSGALDAVVAGDGTLAYVSGVGTGLPSSQRTLVWVDRQGRETAIPAPPRAYVSARLSPDGTRVATWANDQDSDIWLWDLGRATLTRVTFEPGIDNNPAWTPDGRRLIFSSVRAGARNLFWQAADGTGAVERLTESPNQQYEMNVSPDGRRLIFREENPKTGPDVMQVELDGNRHASPLVQSSFSEQNPVVSPDGRWLAYESNESGRDEIYVHPFPEVNRGRWQVSTAGGARPLWVPSGQELFYVAPTGALMRVGVERASSWAATAPTLLIKEGYFTMPAFVATRTYDISPDGQRFLMIKEGTLDEAGALPQLIVVQHFDEEVKRLVPTN